MGRGCNGWYPALGFELLLRALRPLRRLSVHPFSLQQAGPAARDRANAGRQPRKGRKEGKNGSARTCNTPPLRILCALVHPGAAM